MITRISELKNYMIENCYNNNFYSIDGNVIHEGFGIDKWGELYIWYYTERGERENLKYFNTEQEIVEYAYKIIIEDKYAISHLIKYTNDINIKNSIIDELIKRQIDYWIDEIPSFNQVFFRIFVIGCDVNKVRYLMGK